MHLTGVALFADVPGEPVDREGSRRGLAHGVGVLRAGGHLKSVVLVLREAAVAFSFISFHVPRKIRPGAPLHQGVERLHPGVMVHRYCSQISGHYTQLWG